MKRNGSPAERAGRAAKTARRLRRERERVVGWAAGLMLAIPLLFAAVWIRTEVSVELRLRDDLYARRDSLERSILDLTWRKQRLSRWPAVADRVAATGLRPSTIPEVMWVEVSGPWSEGG